MKLSAASWGGWLLETEGALIGYDGENLSYTLEIDTAADTTGYTIYADLEYQDGTKGALPLVKQNGTLRATVGAGYLIPGWAKIQLRGVGTASGTAAPPVKKSSMSRVRIGPSVNAAESLPAPEQAAWDAYAAQMAALRDQAQKAAESVPEIEKQIGDLDDLTTTAKSTLVAAINEAARSGGGGGSGSGYIVDVSEDFAVDGSGKLSLRKADAVEQDNTRPITSAAVYTEVGNINALLATI